jgi:hypothetical protein
VPEAQLKDSGSGLAPASEGWFVVNVRDVEWWFADSRGAECNFESEYGEPQVEFPQLGIRVTVLEPGQSGIYHAESSQEAFLSCQGNAGSSSRAKSDSSGRGTSSTRRRGRSTPSWARATGRA